MGLKLLRLRVGRSSYWASQAPLDESLLIVCLPSPGSLSWGHSLSAPSVSIVALWAETLQWATVGQKVPDLELLCKAHCKAQTAMMPGHISCLGQHIAMGLYGSMRGSMCGSMRGSGLGSIEQEEALSGPCLEAKSLETCHSSSMR